MIKLSRNYIILCYFVKYTSFYGIHVTCLFVCLFFRRVTALLWEVKQLERNARLYNEEESQIVRNSSKLVSVLNAFIR